MENFINVTIPFNKNVSINYDSVCEDTSYYFTDSEYKVVTLMKNKPSIKIEEICKITNFSDSYIRKIIRNLKDNHIIERQGSNKKGVWRVLSQI